MQIIQDAQDNESEYEEIMLPIHDTEDCRPAGHFEEDEWTEGGNHLLTSVLFTVREIISLFVK